MNGDCRPFIFMFNSRWTFVVHLMYGIELFILIIVWLGLHAYRMVCEFAHFWSEPSNGHFTRHQQTQCGWKFLFKAIVDNVFGSKISLHICCEGMFCWSFDRSVIWCTMRTIHKFQLSFRLVQKRKFFRSSIHVVARQNMWSLYLTWCLYGECNKRLHWMHAIAAYAASKFYSKTWTSERSWFEYHDLKFRFCMYWNDWCKSFPNTRLTKLKRKRIDNKKCSTTLFYLHFF